MVIKNVLYFNAFVNSQVIAISFIYLLGTLTKEHILTDISSIVALLGLMRSVNELLC